MKLRLVVIEIGIWLQLILILNTAYQSDIIYNQAEVWLNFN